MTERDGHGGGSPVAVGRPHRDLGRRRQVVGDGALSEVRHVDSDRGPRDQRVRLVVGITHPGDRVEFGPDERLADRLLDRLARAGGHHRVDRAPDGGPELAVSVPPVGDLLGSDAAPDPGGERLDVLRIVREHLVDAGRMGAIQDVRVPLADDQHDRDVGIGRSNPAKEVDAVHVRQLRRGDDAIERRGVEACERIHGVSRGVNGPLRRLERRCDCFESTFVVDD